MMNRRINGNGFQFFIFYVSERQALEQAENLQKLPQKIFLEVGTNEEGQASCRPGDLNSDQDILKLKAILQNKKLPDKLVKVVIPDCAQHNEEAWAKRLPEALRFLSHND